MDQYWYSGWGIGASRDLRNGMIAGLSRVWGVSLPALKGIGRKPWFYPSVLLLIGLMSYAFALPRMGYYWDDWEVVFLLHAKDPALFAGYFAFDRPFAWSYQVMYILVGQNPIAWHLATLLFRWGGILLFCASLKMVWPKLGSYLNWLGALLLVYPGYLQQSISTAYNRHFTAFFIFTLSLYLMLLFIKQSRNAWWLLLLSWCTAFIHIFTIEYFVGLELIRLPLLWILSTSPTQSKRSTRFGQVVLLSLPYLLLLAFYFWWRMIVFPTTIPLTNYAGDIKLLEDFSISFAGGMLVVLTRALQDLLYSTIRVWLAVLGAPGAFTLQSRIAWFAFGAGTILALCFAFLNDVRSAMDRDDDRSWHSFLLVGIMAYVVAALPIWLTSKQLSGGGRWDDRFSLPSMLGSGMMSISLIYWFVRSTYRNLLLGILLALSIASQILVTNRYRLEWDQQNEYYWQLAWRVPALKPQTAVFSLEQPSASIPGYDASFAMNILFDARIADGIVPYWFFTNDRFLNFTFEPGKAISTKDRNLKFFGNTSHAISVVHQGENRCLQVLDQPYASEPFYEAGLEQLVDVSNVSRILSKSGGNTPDHDIFGLEPQHTWCYYFEKADLARQQQDWDAILLLDRESTRRGYTPGFGPEYLPFIEAYAQRGDWQRALSLSRSAQSSIDEMDPLLCATWERLGGLPFADPSLVQEARRTFACAGG